MKGGNGHYFASLIKSCCHVHLNFASRSAFHFDCNGQEIVVKWLVSGVETAPLDVTKLNVSGRK